MADIIKPDGGAPLVSLATPQPADQHPAAVYLAGLGSEKSRAGMRSALGTIARELGVEDPRDVPWASLRYQHLVALRARLAASCAPATANKVLAAVRGVLREAMRLGQMSAEDCARACDVRGVRGFRMPAGRALKPGELVALFQACDGSTVAGARDAAIVGVLYGAGVRRSEAVALDLVHLDLVTGGLRVLGKGNKERSTFVPPGSLRALRAWLAARGEAPGPLFVGISKGDRPTVRRLSDRAIAFILEQVRERAGVASFTSHDMRRTCISDTLDAGGDLVTVAKMVGHAQVTTTQRYDRRGEATMVRTAELLRVPFEGGGKGEDR
jgi:integrase